MIVEEVVEQSGFKPVKLVITLENAVEIRELYHRLNMSIYNVRDTLSPREKVHSAFMNQSKTTITDFFLRVEHIMTQKHIPR